MRPAVVAPAVLVLLAGTPSYAALVEHWWDITYVQANPDGEFDRRVIGVNGSWPPPPVQVTINDTLRVHVHNSLEHPTALHHHGMFFNGTSYHDGAVGITQCPIPPGGTFTYDVPVNTSGQWGTYWVHAHSDGQILDGLRAPFIIHRNADFTTNPVGANFTTGVAKSAPEPYEYDWEYTVLLGDWYHTEHQPLKNRFLSKANPGGAEPVPDNALIYFAQNGKYLPPSTSPGSSISPANVGFNENATITFQPGKTYRLRIINTSGFVMFHFWIEGHEMRIVEVDGTDVEEYPIDHIALTTAQRYSVLVTARNDTKNNFVIHANMDYDMFDQIPDGIKINVTSSITYDDKAELAPLERGELSEYPDVMDQELVPLERIPSASTNKKIDLSVSFDTMTDGTNRAMFNNITFNFPIVPSVFSAYSMGKDANDVNVYGPASYVLEKGDVIDVTVTNLDAGKHPFHLHGHKFAIMNRVLDIESDDPEQNPPIPENLPNPMRRDTVEIPSMNAVTIRFVADNPGAWFFHCHIDWHLTAGLAIVFISDPASIQTLPGAPADHIEVCRGSKTPFTGNAAGHNSTTDLSGLVVGPYLQNNGWHPRGIGAMFGCVLAAVLGMGTVVWYALGSHLTDEEIEEKTREQLEKKKGGFGGFFGKK